MLLEPGRFERRLGGVLRFYAPTDTERTHNVKQKTLSNESALTGVDYYSECIRLPSQRLPRSLLCGTIVLIDKSLCDRCATGDVVPRNRIRRAPRGVRERDRIEFVVLDGFDYSRARVGEHIRGQYKCGDYGETSYDGRDKRGRDATASDLRPGLSEPPRRAASRRVP